ncbi:hypothetical protein UFOVP615_40 [uncultured Caudovirales phage]|uniref:Uncharacterized protein n=1 Tax=uncultured Caudovirales phage TaxID=2100421 RepID=A0A6J5N085_9CAUD|nr:hypothetical protein UFOVP615_40 [uncultured Caudovirales phage]
MIVTREKQGSIICISLKINISDSTFEKLQKSNHFDNFNFTVEEKERFFNFNIEIKPSIGVRTMLLLQDDFSKVQKNIPPSLTSKIKSLESQIKTVGLSEEEKENLKEQLNILNSEFLSNLKNELLTLLSKGDKIEELHEMFFNNKTLTNLLHGEVIVSLDFQERAKLYIDCIEIGLFLTEIVSAEQKKN